LLSQPEIRAKVLRVCDAHRGDPYTQRYCFWMRYVEAHPTTA
jgi:hypothetical protein